MGLARVNADDRQADRLNSCQSQLAMAPVSKPMRSASGARLPIARASAPGSDETLPSNNTFPSKSRTHMAVSFCYTSNLTYCLTASLLLAAF